MTEMLKAVEKLESALGRVMYRWAEVRDTHPEKDEQFQEFIARLQRASYLMEHWIHKTFEP